MEEKKKAVPEGEASLPVQELPADIPAEVRQKLAEDLNEEATEDLKRHNVSLIFIHGKGR